MPEIPSVPQLYSDIQYARMFLNAASREDDPERQRSLAAIGSGFAQLAQVEATWLGSPVGREAPEPPELPEASEARHAAAQAAQATQATQATQSRPSRQLDLRAELDPHGQPPPI
jgi:hypothetical protein